MMELIQNVFSNKNSNIQESYSFSKKLNNLFNQIELLKETKLKVAIYGNGIVGNIVIDKLKNSVVVIVDKEDEIQKDAIALCSPEELNDFDFDVIIVCVLGREIEIRNYLINTLSIDEQKILVFNIDTDITTSYPIFSDEQKHLEKLHNRYSGERCFILGNGPSLSEVPLELLQTEYTFASNFIYKKTLKRDFRPTFYMAEDRFVFKTKGFYKNIANYRCEYLFFPSLYKRELNNVNNNVFFKLDSGLYNTQENLFKDIKFSIDFSKRAYSYFSVIYLQLQLAYYLGFKDIYLLGVDFNYPKNYGNMKHKHQVSDDAMLSGQLLGFQKAKNIFEEDGRSIKNATAGSKLELFEKVNFFSLLKEFSDEK